MITEPSADPAVAQISGIVADLQKDVDFGPIVSDEFRRGYSAARFDLAPILDVAITEIVVADRARREAREEDPARGE